ncbi:MAG: beta-galactosidase [Oscillospiraceae bacterium]|jgi:beta-galactosidase|nr:beta-galactosidase [Oscillospiraceae bacterium]
MPVFSHAAMLHGADYNPDQWLDYPDVLEADLELMEKAGVNCVSLGIFAWARLEPREGQYDFAWMREIVDKLRGRGVYTILATPTAAKPNWMSEKYEEVRRVDKNGRRDMSGGRHNHCYTSPVYREKTAKINAALAGEFGSHPGVILWHISNEYGGECYCPLCAEAFRAWLREKYGTLERLNHEWWSHFWSHTFTEWEHIHPPMPHGEMCINGHCLDWKRFVTRQTADFMKAEVAALREGGSALPVTANLMGFYNGLDYFKFAPLLDIVSWDNYPTWHDENPDELAVPAFTALTHDLMRGVGDGKPFLLMESTPSMTNWKPTSRPKRPGMHMLSSMQALAHGSDSVQYFQWRKSRGSCEKFHGAVVDHCGRSDHRVFTDVARLGARLQGLSAVTGSRVPARVALVYDWENRWALEGAQGPRNMGIHYLETLAEHHRPFWEMGINTDVRDMSGDISGYDLVIAPMLYMYRAGFARKLAAFTRGGGTLVGTYWSGVVNENDLCYLGPRPGEGMAEVFGVRAEEIDSLYDSQRNSFTYEGESYRLSELCELVATEGAEPLAVYGQDFYAGRPALTRCGHGKGTAYYIAAKPEARFLKAFYARLADTLNLRPPIVPAVPCGVELTRRKAEGGREYWFFQNFTREGISVELRFPLYNAETGEEASRAELKPYESGVYTDTAP